ncbi:hypothetical protein EVAR_24219_1 [Eumeta japonica]|uniref:Uncharacterized protein n=1 Tax=Eumeta variegata TaxID=151549 RepID=A0A4C1W3E5_EUMVA|nr:hypothetical protein EVAR_24219_1 [Eumeta japonica]
MILKLPQHHHNDSATAYPVSVSDAMFQRPVDRTEGGISLGSGYERAYTRASIYGNIENKLDRPARAAGRAASASSAITKSLVFGAAARVSGRIRKSSKSKLYAPFAVEIGNTRYYSNNNRTPKSAAGASARPGHATT